MKIRVAKNLEKDSIVNGRGLRIVIWNQGCLHKCPGCHNPETHDINGGFIMDTDIIKEQLKKLNYHDGITLSGGDPMLQVEANLDIAKFAKKMGLNVWCYTGFIFENLKKNPKYDELLNYIDVLVDGKFILEQKSLNIKYRGSTNQRLIDVNKSLANKDIVLLKEEKNKKEIKEIIFV